MLQISDWECIETIRKLYLTSLVALFRKGSILQLALSMMASVVAFGLHALRLPYKENWLNNLQFSSLFLIVFTFIAGITYQIEIIFASLLTSMWDRQYIEVS